MKFTDLRFVRRSFQGAYVFSAWIGQYVHEVQIFADNKREARSMAREMFQNME